MRISLSYTNIANADFYIMFCIAKNSPAQSTREVGGLHALVILSENLHSSALSDASRHIWADARVGCL